MLLAMHDDDGDILRLRVSGKITQTHLGGAANPLEKLGVVNMPARKVLLDLSRAEYIDSSGISWLLENHKAFRAAGGRFVMHSMSAIVANTIRVLSMHLVFEIGATEEEALKMIRQPPKPPGQKPAP